MQASGDVLALAFLQGKGLAAGSGAVAYGAVAHGAVANGAVAYVAGDSGSFTKCASAKHPVLMVQLLSMQLLMLQALLLQLLKVQLLKVRLSLVQLPMDPSLNVQLLNLQLVMVQLLSMQLLMVQLKSAGSAVNDFSWLSGPRRPHPDPQWVVPLESGRLSGRRRSSGCRSAALLSRNAGSRRLQFAA